VPYVDAYLIWDAFNLCLLVAIPLIVRPHISLLQKAPTVFWFLLSLACFPVFVALLQGQDIIVFVLFIALAFRSLKTGRDLSAGMWLGAGMFRFHLVIPIFLLLLVRKNWRAVWGLLIAALGFGLISLALVGWQTLLEYPRFVLQMEQSLGHGSSITADMPNLRGVASLIGAGPLMMAAIVTTSLIVFAFAATRWPFTDRDSQFDM
jgi:hypothetical protein